MSPRVFHMLGKCGNRCDATSLLLAECADRVVLSFRYHLDVLNLPAFQRSMVFGDSHEIAPDKVIWQTALEFCMKIPKIDKMKVRLRKFVFWVSLGLAGLFWLAYYQFFFKWRGCFNELGRCFDADRGVVYLEQAGMVWLALATLASCTMLYQLWRLTR